MTDIPNKEIFWLEPEDFVHIPKSYAEKSDGVFEEFSHLGIEIDSKLYFLTSELIGIICENNIKTSIIQDSVNGPLNMSPEIMKSISTKGIISASTISLLNIFYGVKDVQYGTGTFSLGLPLTRDQAILLKLSK